MALSLLLFLSPSLLASGQGRLVAGGRGTVHCLSTNKKQFTKVCVRNVIQINYERPSVAPAQFVVSTAVLFT